MAHSRRNTKKSDAVGDFYIYPKGGLYSTHQHLEFFTELMSGQQQNAKTTDRNDAHSPHVSLKK